ncbi:MAG: UDP-N-acetylglucosamine 2-epimerase (non-hydrolyzing) [Candidatus Eisenbacteria bacterium]
MTGERTVVSVFGTRPEIIKMAPVLRALAGRPGIRSKVVLTSQHTDLARPFLDRFGVSADRDLAVMRPNQTPEEVSAKVLTGLGPVLAEWEASLVLVQGDTATAFAAALAAFYRRVPVGHVEAGLRTSDPTNPFPEEMHRRMVGRLASIHFAATERNRAALLAEGVEPGRIHVTGNTVVDALQLTLRTTDPTAALGKLLAASDGRRRIVLTTHRRESFGELMAGNLRVLREFVSKHADVELLFPVHPNPSVRRPTEEILGNVDRVHLLDPMDYSDFLHLLKSAWLVVSDSGGVQEEVPSLGKALLVLRENTERPEVVECGIAELVGGEPEVLRRRLLELHADDRWIQEARSIANPFGDGTAAEKIASLVEEFVSP